MVTWWMLASVPVRRAPVGLVAKVEPTQRRAPVAPTQFHLAKRGGSAEAELLVAVLGGRGEHPRSDGLCTIQISAAHGEPRSASVQRQELGIERALHEGGQRRRDGGGLVQRVAPHQETHAKPPSRVGVALRPRRGHCPVQAVEPAGRASEVAHPHVPLGEVGAACEHGGPVAAAPGGAVGLREREAAL